MGDLMLLSVIVPVYNAQAYLDRLFNSIKDQLNKEVELIFVDDGSLDNGYSILCDYMKEYPEIRIYQQKNSGAASARQLGLDKAQGEFITFIDSDDVVCKGYFQYILQLLEQEKKYDMYVLSYQTFFSSKKIMLRVNEKKIYTSGKDYVKAVFEEKIIGDAALWNHIYSKRFIRSNNFSFDVESKIAEDCLFNDACMQVVSTVYVSDFVGYTWICDHDSLTGRCPDTMGETLKKHIDNLKILKEKYLKEDQKAQNYILKVQASFFKYLMENIQKSKLDRRTKNYRMEMALTNNIDLETIKSQYKGIQKILLTEAWKKKSSIWYNLFYWCNIGTIKQKMMSGLITVVKKGYKKEI